MDKTVTVVDVDGGIQNLFVHSVAQQDQRLKRLYPLKRALNQQAVYSFQFGDGEC